MLNQVSFKDLFSTNPGQLVRRNQDSDNGSQNNSQYLYSQVEYPDSQDFNASQLNSSQASQKSDSPGKKFYQRYMSKGPLFSRDVANKALPVTSAVTANKINYQHQLQVNKAKTLDRDERDMLNTMLSSLKECTAEVKSVVEVVKENIQHGASLTESSLSRYLEKIEQGLLQNNSGFLQALSIRDNIHEEVTKLKQELVAKDARIKELKGMLDEVKNCKDRDILDHLKEIKDSCSENQEHVDKTVHSLFDGRRSELQKETKQLEKKQSEYSKLTEKCQTKLIEQHQTVLEEIESRVSEALGWHEQHNKGSQTQLLQQFHSSLSAFSEKISNQVSCLLKAQMTDLSSRSKDEQSEIFQLQMDQLTKLLDEHKTSMQKSLQKQLAESGSQDMLKLDSSVEKLCELEKQNALQAKTEQLKSIQEQEQQKHKEKLEKLKHRHEEEVKRLLSEQASTVEVGKSKAVSCVLPYQVPASHLLSPVMKNTSGNADARNYPGQYGTAAESNASTASVVAHQHKPPAAADVFSVSTSSFVSPILPTASTWSSKYLFGRNNTKPSPVSAVLPQLAHKIVAGSFRANQVTASENQLTKSTDEENGKKTNNKVSRRRRRGGYLTFPKKKKKYSVNLEGANIEKESVQSETLPSTEPLRKSPNNATNELPWQPYGKSSVFEFDDEGDEDLKSLTFNKPMQQINTKRAEVKPMQQVTNQQYCSDPTSDAQWQAIINLPNKPVASWPRMCSTYLKNQVMSPTQGSNCSDLSSQDNCEDSGSFWSSSPALSVTELIIRTQVQGPKQTANSVNQDCNRIQRDAILPQPYRNAKHGSSSPTQHNVVSTVALRHSRKTPRVRVTRSQSHQY